MILQKLTLSALFLLMSLQNISTSEPIMPTLYAPWRSSYIDQTYALSHTCKLCNEIADNNQQSLVLCKNTHAYVIMNRYPYTLGHLLIIPTEHCAEFHQLSPEARHEIAELLCACITILQRLYTIDGYTVGINYGKAAGASITDHFHMHIVPRRIGDTSFMVVCSGTQVVNHNLFDAYDQLQQAFLSYNSHS